MVFGVQKMFFIIKHLHSYCTPNCTKEFFIFFPPLDGFFLNQKNFFFRMPDINHVKIRIGQILKSNLNRSSNGL